MTASTSLSLATEIAIILRAQIPQYPPGNRNAEAFDEASKIVVREEKLRSALADLEYLARNRTTTRIMLRDRIQAILANAEVSGPGAKPQCPL
jgi:hypothetical protein